MAHTNTKETEKIPIGSCEAYITEFTGTIPADLNFETEDNRLGYVKSGASLEYTQTRQEVKDDLGKVYKVITTDEQVVVKLGILTWNANTLAKLTTTGRVTESGNKRLLKVGGLKNAVNKKYALRLVNKDDVDGDIRVTVVGYSSAGFTIPFNPASDTGNMINPEFTALPSDSDGTLIIYEEEILTAANEPDPSGTSEDPA